MRTERYTSRQDDVYICTEQGVVYFVNIDQRDELLVRTTCPVGALRGRISTAFASLDLGGNQSEVLIAAGDDSIGGMYLVRINSARSVHT